MGDTLMKVHLPVGYVMGYLRYGHFEGEVPFTKEEEEDFKKLLEIDEGELTEEECDKLEHYKDMVDGYCELVIDDVDIEGYGDIEWKDLFK